MKDHPCGLERLLCSSALLLHVPRWKEDLSQLSLDSNGLPCSLFSIAEVEAPEVQDRLVYCYPVRLAIPSPPLPSVEMHMENNVACVRYKGEMVKVSRNYFSKLVRADCHACMTAAAQCSFMRAFISPFPPRRDRAVGHSTALWRLSGVALIVARMRTASFSLVRVSLLLEALRRCCVSALVHAVLQEWLYSTEAALDERDLLMCYIHSC